MNVRVDVLAKVRVKAIVAVVVMVGVDVLVCVTVFAGVSVAVPVGMTVGMEAIKEDAAAPTDETSWATINTMAMSVAAMPPEARDLLA